MSAGRVDDAELGRLGELAAGIVPHARVMLAVDANVAATHGGIGAVESADRVLDVGGDPIPARGEDQRVLPFVVGFRLVPSFGVRGQLRIALLVALIVTLGNISFPVAVLTGMVG